MKRAERKSFGKPDEVRKFPKGKVELVKIGGAIIPTSRDAQAGLEMVDLRSAHRQDEELQSASLPIPRRGNHSRQDG